MSLMLRLLSITLLASVVLSAQNQKDIQMLEEYLTEQFEDNPRVQSASVHVDEVVPLKEIPGWSGYIIKVEADLKTKPPRNVKQRMIWFSNGTLITRDITDMRSGDSLKELVKPKFKEEYYTKDNLIYGNANAKHKVALFSDPLCPFCRGYIPGAIKDMKKDPNKFAVYYYHFPLERLHPASVELVKMAAAAHKKGVKDAVLKLYNVQINPREKDVKKILKAFNKAVGTNLTLKDIQDPEVMKHVQNDLKIAEELMVAGTPTVYLDGELDRGKKKYKKIK